MTIGQFSELKTAIANALGRSNLTSRIAEWAEMAEQDAALQLRIRAM